MAVPNIILPDDYALITQDESILGIEAEIFQFGTIALVPESADTYEAGDAVMYDPTDAPKFIYDGDVYFLIKEDKIFFKEVVPP